MDTDNPDHEEAVLPPLEVTVLRPLEVAVMSPLEVAEEAAELEKAAHCAFSRFASPRSVPVGTTTWPQVDPAEHAGLLMIADRQINGNGLPKPRIEDLQDEPSPVKPELGFYSLTNLSTLATEGLEDSAKEFDDDGFWDLAAPPPPSKVEDLDSISLSRANEDHSVAPEAKVKAALEKIPKDTDGADNSYAAPRPALSACADERVQVSPPDELDPVLELRRIQAERTFNMDKLWMSLPGNDISKYGPGEYEAKLDAQIEAQARKKAEFIAANMPRDMREDHSKLTEEELEAYRHPWSCVDYPCDTSDFTDTTDDSGDLTEVTPMSSLAPSPMPDMEEAMAAGVEASDETASPPTLVFCKTRLAESWLDKLEEAGALEEDSANPGPLNAGAELPTFSFDSGMEDGSPVPPKGESGQSSESGRGSFSSRGGGDIDFSQSSLIPNQKLSAETEEFFREQKAMSVVGRGNRRSPRRPAGCNKSFPPNEASRIERTNQILLGRLVDTAQGAVLAQKFSFSGGPKSKRKPPLPILVPPQTRIPFGSRSSVSGRAKHVAPSALFRKRNIRRIELENQVLLKRLRVVKASKEITVNFSKKKD